MTTNLKIGYPDIPYTSIITESPSSTSDYEAINTATGRTDKYYWSGTSQATHRITYDLGAASTKSASYLYINRVNLLTEQSAGYYLKLERSSDNSSYTPEVDDSPITASRICGSVDQDYIYEFSQSSAFRYWRLELGLDGGGDCKPRFGKAFFGSWFDFGRDPIYSTIGIDHVDTTHWPRRQPLKVRLKYEGLSNAIRESFLSTIVKKSQSFGLVLYDENDYILNGYKTLYCKLQRCRFTPKNNGYNDLELELMEVI